MLDNTTPIWDLYKKGVEHHTTAKMYTNAETCHNFYIGDQWKGAKIGNEEFPVFNFIKPICKYKINMVAQNSMAIVFQSMGEQNQEVASQLTSYAAAVWEKSKMDTLMRRVIKFSCITGDDYLYWYAETPSRDAANPRKTVTLKARPVNSTNIYFSDEQNPDINEQEWIIISERIPVSKVRKIAEGNKIAPELITLITGDEEFQTQVGQESGDEVKTELGKCTSLLFISRTAEGISFSRSVRSVVYEPAKPIAGLDVFPIVGMRWEDRVGSARGVSAVQYILPNQLIVNKTAARRAIVVKTSAFPHTAYDAQKVQNIGDLERVGGRIAIDNLANNRVTDLIQHLQPAPMSSDAQTLQNEIMEQTRQLEGAGDAATGDIDPTKASGEAIKAARDQAAVPLNEQIASFKQFIEDTAILWFKLWVAYAPDGLEVTYRDNGQAATEVINSDILLSIEPDVKIEVSPVDPYSQLSQQVALDRLLERQQIEFSEYVEALDDSSSVPKAKLQGILEARNAAIPPELLEALRQDPNLVAELMQMLQASMMGGQQNDMPPM